jgi:hypothetical protein
MEKDKVIKSNAPEKIYINSNIENRTWLIGKGNTSFIEYTRTNAFIEKACNWLEQTLSPYIPYCDIDIDLAIENFKKYMKGE